MRDNPLEGMLTIKMTVTLPTTNPRRKRVVLAKSWCKRDDAHDELGKWLGVNKHVKSLNQPAGRKPCIYGECKMKPWNEMSVMEQMRAEYSDLYKDTFGFRPSIEHRMEIAKMSDEEFVMQFDTLLDMMQCDSEFEQQVHIERRKLENRDWEKGN